MTVKPFIWKEKINRGKERERKREKARRERKNERKSERAERSLGWSDRGSDATVPKARTH